MRIVIIADAYPPMRTSGAVQLRDLAQELLWQSHKPIVLLPSSDIDLPWLREEMNGVEVLRRINAGMAWSGIRPRYSWGPLPGRSSNPALAAAT
jgi:hypothetical protein